MVSNMDCLARTVVPGSSEEWAIQSLSSAVPVFPGAKQMKE